MRRLGPFLRDAWRLSRPYFVSDERWSARFLLAAIITLNLALVGMNVVLNFWNRAFYNTLEADKETSLKDWNGFIDLLLFYRNDAKNGFMPGFTVIVFCFIVVAIYRRYLIQWLQIRWRRWLTQRYVDEWLTDRSYYRISLQAADDGTDNPDQRIADDIEKFITFTLTLGLELLSNIVTLFSFLSILWTLSGPLTLLGIAIPGYMVWVALFYSVFGTIAAHFVGRPLAALNFRQQRVEADFRFSLARLRENMEGIAISGGEAEENRGLAQRFTAVIGNWYLIMRRARLMNSLVLGFNQAAVIFPFVVAAPRYFFGAMSLGELTQTADAFGQVQSAMSWFVSAYSNMQSDADLVRWRATVERLVTFRDAIEAARASSGKGITGSDGNHFSLKDATIGLPNGQTLIEHANLSLLSGQSVVITGRSGSGKSTLFRVFSGIWPFGSGTLRRPATNKMFLPQRPYSPLGTLRRAVTYPAGIAAYHDAEVEAALTDAGLPHLLPRLDDEDSWAQRLSGGEQQRVALARALLAKPAWLFLDEATASLDPEAEAALYATLRQRLPGTTIISISHRPAVAKMHDRHIVFVRPGDQPGQLVDLLRTAPQP